jgi:mono/diheme cytochrome c family protein
VTQQRLSAATWKAEIVKMRGFGSPLPAADEASVIAYLAVHLGPSVPQPPPNTVVTAPPVTYTNAETAASTSTANAPSKGAAGSPAGAQLYAQNCAACHGAAGAGVPGAFPPLVHDPVVTAANPAAHISAVLKGVHGKAIGGKSYSSPMPPFAQLSDNDIAAIINHERTSWGNHAPTVTPAQVKSAR